MAQKLVTVVSPEGKPDKSQRTPEVKGNSSRFKSIIRKLGPGIITGASDDDPSGIVTYSQAGAQFGITTLWTTLLTFPLMANIQEMCARIGLVTSTGLTATIKKYYSKTLLYIILIFCIPAITLNIGADIQGMGTVAHMIFPRIPVAVFCVGLTAVLMFAIIQYPYLKIARILKWLCLSLLLYLIVPFLHNQNWSEIAKNTFVPTIHPDKDFILILVAILGTTISPYLFFWQAIMEKEDVAHKQGKTFINKRVLDEIKLDVNLGMLLSNLVMFFIILTAGTVLYPAGVHRIDTVDQAAKALEPLAGEFAYFIFAIGVLGTGFLAIPVLAGSQSYMLAETFGWKAGLDKKFTKAKEFYATIILSLLVGLSLDFFDISPIKTLLYTAVLYGLISPLLIVTVLIIANNKKIMKNKTNSRISNFLGITTLCLMSIAAITLIYFLFE